MESAVKDTLREISLASEAGVLNFLEHIGQMHGVVVELAAQFEGDEEVDRWVDYANLMYQKLKEELHTVQSLIAAEQPLSKQIVSDIQQIYNELTLARDTIASIELEEVVSEVLEETSHTPVTVPVVTSQNPYKRQFLTADITSYEPYQAVLTEHFSSPKAFESHMRYIVKDFEEPSKLDKVLKVRQASIFYELIGGMSLQELDELLATPRQQLRDLLTEQKMDYRLFVEWIDLIELLRETLAAEDSMTVSELLAIAEIEGLAAEKSTT